MLFFSYSAIVKAFSERVADDGATKESLACVDEKLKL